jgi:hypothetical protein
MSLFVSMFAHAETGKVAIGFGTSVPKDGSVTTTERTGISRAGGGERFTVTFRNYKTVNRIRLTGYSTGKAGKVLVHTALGLVTYDNGTHEQINFEGLSQFAKATAGNPTNYNNNSMLENTHYVEVTPNAPFNELQITVEGFTNNDASMVMELETAEDLPAEDYIIHRTGAEEVAGAFIDEANYPALTGPELSSLVEHGSMPGIENLAGNTFVCTSYVKGSPAQVDYKTRSYYDNNGALQSASNIDSTMATWVNTEQGWTLGTTAKNGCGKFNLRTILRMTAAGNIIGELNINRYDYLTLCANAGIDWNAQAARFDNESYPSVINPDIDRTAGYEFCRPSVVQ